MTEPSQNSPSLSPLKRAFLAIEELQTKLAAAQAAASEPIAIIGLGCRFPGDAVTPAAFWELLRSGRDAVAEVPAGRWPVGAFFDADPAVPGKMATRHGGFLGDVESFDPAYFGISPREAASMDPQHRLLLEVAWEALSAAGQKRERLAANPTGVFVGITTAEFGQLQLATEGLSALDAYHITGNALNAAAGRLAFVFGLHGPCMAVDTACSSSLVALHLACQSLRAGECETALAGGVNLILSPLGSIALSQGRVLSADGKAKTFDAAADGMVRGEGCGLLVLKKLSAAQRDGDRILAVVRGSGVNQDGPSSGLTVPNGPAQEALLRRVLEVARVDPAAVDYVEAHGTGTALGDPIEVGALGSVYGVGRAADHPLWLGSVKTNLGHLESAAGIAGVIKAVLALHHEAIPPHLNFTKPSPHIDWANLPVRVPTALQPWRRGARARLAAVSAFGFSGTNAHVLLEEAPAANAVASAANDPRGLVAPPSPFKRERFSLPRPASYGALPSAGANAHPLLGREVALAGAEERRFEAMLAPFAPAWLADHRVFDHVVVPATAWLEIAHAAGRATGNDHFAVREFSIEQALVLDAARASALQTVVKPDGRVEIFARHEDGWRRHATAQIVRESAKTVPRDDLASARSRCTTAREIAAIYQAYGSRGLGYGPAFRALANVWRGDGEVVAEIVRPREAAAEAYALHPVLLDACFQAAGAAFDGPEEVFLPMQAAHWTVRAAAAGDRVWCHARVKTTAEGAVVDLTLWNEDGSLVAQLDHLVLQRATPEALRRVVQRGGDWLYEIAWPVARGAVAQAKLSGDWLVVDDRDGVAARLRTAGAQVTSIAAAALAETLTRRDAWRGVVGANVVALEPLLTLARGLAKAEAVWLVTRGAVAVKGESVSPDAAAVWGLGRVLMQEHPEWSLRLLDVDDVSAANAVVGECLASDTETQTAWRAGVRHAARLRRLELPATAMAPIALRADATYLVTGGLGALGLLAANWLVSRGAKHLVLVARRAPDAAAQARIAQWTVAGVRVEMRAVDMAQRETVAALLATLPALRGIVHAAGATADGAARQLTSERISQVFAPKADGARHLHELAGDLDFFVLFSSTASVFGTPGQGNYAAANAYLDGLAQARRAQGQAALSVNWGGWSVGLAAGLGDRYAARGIGAITPARGFAELERLLSANVAQAVVLPVTWKTFFASLPGGRVPALLTELVPANRETGTDVIGEFRARLAQAPVADHAGLVAELVRGEIARVLRLAPEKLDPNQSFSALGFDSIMAVDVRNRLRLATDADVPLVALLENGTVASIAQIIDGRLNEGGRRPPGDGGLGSSGDQSGQTAPGGRGPPQAFELSAGQEALWFLHQAAPDSSAYNTAVALRLRGALDREKLRRILATLAARHPLLRASFALEGGRPVMRIASEATPELREIDASSWTAERLAREVAADYQRPFRLGAGAVFRATRFVTAADEQVLLIGVHHIVGDAWTNWVLLDELRQLLAGADTLPSVAGTYADFVRWQRELLASAEGERLWSFWQRELAGELTPLALPTDFPRPPVLTPQGASAPLALETGVWEKLRGVARAHGTTPFAVLLAAFQVFLHRHTGQEEIIVGSPTSGRSRPEFSGVAGYFVNPVPLRARLAGRATFADFLAQVKRTVLGALAHADLPLPLLVERLKLPRDPSRPALFQSLFVFQKPPQTDARGDALKAGTGASARGAWGGLDVTEFPLAQMEGQFELTLEIFEDRGGSLKYNTALFTPETAARFATRFTTLLDAIVADPALRIDELPLMDAAERCLVVQTWNHTPADYPQQFCLHELIAQQVARTPDAPALTFEGQMLSYRQLDARANQLAHWLRRAGVRPDTLVGVCAERSLELVIALLGILKSGGAYVPLDPGYPRERLAFMTEDSAVSLVLTQEKFAGELRASGVKTLRLDADWAEVARESAASPASAVTPDHLAYMIYTSGSTGRPKGATNTHRAIVNRLLWMQDAYRLTATDTVVQKTPFSFDVSVWEFFWPLLAGARLVVAKPGGHQDAAYLADLVARERVTTMHFVPSMLQVFVEQPGLARCPALRQVFCSGEALPFELQERFFARHHAELHNLYGPTEAAVDVTFWKCERGSIRRIVPIGRPIARMQMHVLDARLQPVPVGVAGELHIGGIGLARGYHRRPELTAEKFIPDPFGAPGARLYKTGDLARWLADGAIEYLGRLDHQVKLRGFRIELGEIETALAREPGVREATVIVREDRPGEKAIVAYVVAANGSALSSADLRRALRGSLPDYMVPSDFVMLPALPLSPNGKVDRKALPAPMRDHVESGVRFVAPESATEQLLATLWREALGRDRVGVEDNFFDLGGHSLKLGQVHARLQTRFPNPPALLELFQYPTIRVLAARLDGVSADKANGGTKAAADTPTSTAPAATPKRDALTDQRSLRRAAREGKAVR